MTATMQTASLPPLGIHQRDEIGQQLQATLIELLDLALVGKQLHWSVAGPLFRPLHQHLDELVDAWHDLADAVAERAVALGSFPDGQATAVATGGTTPLARGPIRDEAVVRELTHRLAATAERARARMDRLGALDAASQDVLIGAVRTLEQQLWMIRAQFPLARD